MNFPKKDRRVTTPPIVISLMSYQLAIAIQILPIES